MNRQMVKENGEVKNSSYVKQETVGYGYDPSYVKQETVGYGYDPSYVKQETVGYGYDPSYLSYSTATATPTTLNQPLPGQPPLPPMPPPQGTVPPPPSVYGSVQAQVTPIHAWPHAAAWQWITPQPTPMPAQAAAAAAAAFQREMPMRNNYVKRERFNNHNRNSMYQQRDNFHRKNRNRQQQRYEQSQQSQFDQASYYGAALTNSLGLDWQRSNEALLSMQLPMQSQLQHMASTVANSRRPEDSNDPDIKEEIVIKKNKQRKPMSQSYPSRPWNRDDAERALKIENEYNKTVKAQSLIIKFPDPDLNKDIVREFHSGIQNIHFQSPSGPRYCFIQMAENIDIDETIKELEKIPFGNGHLKVERKSLRDEDTPTPEEIDPYTLYIGNLPESVNVNEVKSKFQTAARVDVGYAQKMRNTRYAFIRYNSVDESIAAYRQAHDLTWDTRSIIVRFRRQRGNTCLPGEPKSNPKKKDEIPKAPSATDNTQEKDKSNGESNKSHIASSDISCPQSKSSENKHTPESNSSISIGDSSAKESSVNRKEQLPLDSTASSKPTEDEVTIQDDDIITEIKEEPIDYDDINEMSMGEDDDDDDDEGEIYNHEVEEDDEDSDYDDDLSNLKPSASEDSRNVTLEDDIPSDNLDKLFSDLNHSIAGDIGS